jgi:hypothetical protein
MPSECIHLSAMRKSVVWYERGALDFECVEREKFNSERKEREFCIFIESFVEKADEKKNNS